jgi:arylsulfatase A-like enzyme
MELWDEFAGIDHEPMPPSRPLNRMFDFDRFDEVSPWNHLFDWGVLPPDREPEVPDHLSVTAVAEFLQRTHAEPFFCALGLYKPHLPWYAPQRFYDLYPIESVALPVVKEDDLEDVPQIAQKWARSPPDHETVIQHGQWRNAVQGYLASISYCDDFVGQTLDALQASPYADNTIVVLWGDNGFHLGEKLHWRKFVLWEEACRVPFIISMLGQRTPSRVDTPVSLVDLFPTLCALCDVGPMGNVDGVSLLDILNGAEVERGRPAEMIWGKGNRSIRSNQWRYTRYIDGSEELYDHNSDPSEWTNLARIDGFDSVLSAMRSSLSTNSRD